MAASLPTLVLALLAAAAAPGEPSPAECPAPAQLAAALNALLPGLAPAAPVASPLALASGGRLGVSTSSEGDVRVELVDAQGEIVLHRVLPAPPRGHAADCPALAETIALIVERYLHDVGYEAPPLPPPTPTAPPAPPPPATPPTAVVVAAPPAPAAASRVLWRLGLAAGARRGDGGDFDGDGDLALGVEPAAPAARWGARLSVGLAPSSQARFSERTATLRRLPLRLGAYRSFAAGPGRLEPGVGAGVDLLVVSATGPGTASGVHLAPTGDLALGYTLALTPALYVRLLSRVALAVPYVFKDLAGAQVWGTPRVFGEAGVELGLAFR